DLVIRGFGAEIRTKKEVENIYLASTPEAHDSSLRRIGSSHFGTRHRSMMRYCFSDPKSIGFVVSQDGDIRAMTNVKGRLVVWENPKVLSFSRSIIKDKDLVLSKKSKPSRGSIDEKSLV